MRNNNLFEIYKLIKIAFCVFLYIAQASGQSVPKTDLPVIQPTLPTLILPSMDNFIIPTSNYSTSSGNTYQQQQNRRIMNEVDQHEKLRQETLYSVKSDIDELRSEIHYDLPSKSNIEGTSAYKILFDKMLTLDVNNYSVKGVNFDIENAYFNNKADKSQFDQIIHHTGEFLTAKMKELKYDHNSNSAKNYILFQFFSEEMKLGKQTHLPFKYDFEDYMGVKDYSKMFVSKLLSTGSGQCHSLPLLYLILAEEIGAEAYLSLSPNHSYIRFPDDRGKWYNIELTNGMFSTESYISQSGYIKSEALQNKIYMENLSKKELLSKHFSDLAEGYIHKFGYDEFAQSVIDKALELYPNSISANMINANLATVRVKYVVKQLGIDISDGKEREKILNYPKAVELLKEMQKQYAVIDNLGYENMPPEEYQKWLQSMKGEKQREETKVIEKQFKGAIIKSTKQLKD
ncbi:hypothetical protein [Flavobacterium piscis]|uniref:Regulator of sirC expression with transglutaminase-like and TPR domain n=1 Tax=Flavobacterium piscis TaxID=1114874 RepID=A0ABU1Y3N1_9FLAO|nr:hypothetical protein [Flavobacterium piscis]MDR7208837.1 regulator of sirC expression with transglutaminase-like and TPR domain [Flavobacterium piscis]